jgi:lipopolysaccharide transport system ATP-binding protein
MSELVIRAENIGKRYNLGKRQVSPGDVPRTFAQRLGGVFSRGPRRPKDDEFWAVKDLSFEISQNQVVGIIGSNGAGKSTLLKILSRITEPSTGSVRIHGRVGSLLEVGTGFHPELSGRENIFLNGAIIGMKRADIRKKFDEIVEFAGVDELLDTPIKRYSSGMHMRLAFSVAAHLDPDILIVDEVLAVGDAEFQKKCLGKLEDVATRSQRTVLFVSHNLQAVQSLCSRVMHLDRGRLVAFGESRSVVGQYLTKVSSNESVRLWTDGAPGSSQVKLKRLAVSADNNHSGVYSSSHDISIEMDVVSTAELPNVGVGFDLATAEGVHILRTYQTGRRYEGPDSLRIGENRWRCMVPAGLLNGGVYQVFPKIKDAQNRWILDGPATVSFEIVLDHGVSPYWNSLDGNTRPGMIAPILDWKTIPVESGVCDSTSLIR